jgi:hypothetical protein
MFFFVGGRIIIRSTLSSQRNCQVNFSTFDQELLLIYLFWCRARTLLCVSNKVFCINHLKKIFHVEIEATNQYGWGKQ